MYFIIFGGKKYYFSYPLSPTSSIEFKMLARLTRLNKALRNSASLNFLQISKSGLAQSLWLERTFWNARDMNIVKAKYFKTNLNSHTSDCISPVCVNGAVWQFTRIQASKMFENCWYYGCLDSDRSTSLYTVKHAVICKHRHRVARK